MIIPTKLVKKSRKAPVASSKSLVAKPIPTTHKGGTRATDIATPGIASETLRRILAKAPATPAEIATPKSNKVGSVRARISEPGTLNPIISVAKKATHPASTASCSSPGGRSGRSAT